MTARIADQAAGVLQGAADAVQGVKHHARSDDLSPHPVGREEVAMARWHAGTLGSLPATPSSVTSTPCLRTTPPLA